MYTLEDSESQLYVPIAALECRGCEILSFDPKVRSLRDSTRVIPYRHTHIHIYWTVQGVWSCKGSESNTPFEEVELSLDEEDGWNDYDEKVRCIPIELHALSANNAFSGTSSSRVVSRWE